MSATPRNGTAPCPQRGKRSLPRRMQLEHHDRDDNCQHAVAESLEAGLFHFRRKPRFIARDETGIPAEPGSLPWFLVERYRLFAASGDGALSTIRVHHAPYSVLDVDVRSWGVTTFSLAGLTPPSNFPEHACAAEPLDVEVFPREDANAP